MTGSNNSGCVPGSEANFLAVRNADGTYRVRDCVTMPPIPKVDLDLLRSHPGLRRIFLDLIEIYPEILQTYSDLLRLYPELSRLESGPASIVDDIIAARKATHVASVIDAALANIHGRGSL